jgi:hypothetical protein
MQSRLVASSDSCAPLGGRLNLGTEGLRSRPPDSTNNQFLPVTLRICMPRDSYRKNGALKADGSFPRLTYL